jgi:hypothetical protein
MIRKLYRLKKGVNPDTIDFMSNSDFEEITDRDLQAMIENYPVCFAAFDDVYVAIPTNIGGYYYTSLSYLINDAIEEELNVYGVE